MSLATIRTALKAAIESVTDVGVVTDFEPLATRQEHFETYFKAPALAYVQGWTITREATLERGHVTQANQSAHLMVIRGYRALSIDGSTEKAFQDLVEAVRARLRLEQRDQLGGVAMVDPPSVRIFQPLTFAGYLVHYVEITLRCVESLTIVP